MNWWIVWLPMAELVIGGLLTLFFAEKFKETALLVVVQIVLYMVLMNGLLIYGLWYHSHHSM